MFGKFVGLCSISEANNSESKRANFFITHNNSYFVLYIKQKAESCSNLDFFYFFFNLRGVLLKKMYIWLDFEKNKFRNIVLIWQNAQILSPF